MFDNVERVTLIGSRKVPHDIKLLQYTIGAAIREKGITRISGGATGSDTNFLIGDNSNDHIIIPHNGFNNLHSSKDDDTIIALEDIDPIFEIEAVQYIEDTYGEISDEFTRNAYTRNYFQIESRLGRTDLVIYYAPQNGFTVKGGTKVAVYLAKELGIPCYNIGIKEDLKAVLKALDINHITETYKHTLWDFL